MSSSAPRRYAPLPSWLIWTAGFISFPIAGIAAGAIAGPVTSPATSAARGRFTGPAIAPAAMPAMGKEMKPAVQISQDGRGAYRRGAEELMTHCPLAP